MATTVFLSDDHPVYRGGLAEAIDVRADLELVGEAAEGNEAIERITELQPDVAVVDLRLPGIDGLEIAKRIQHNGLPTRTLVLSGFTEGALVHEAMRSGAGGYMSKDAEAAEIVAAIRRLAAGETVLAPELEHKLVEHISRLPDSGAAMPSDREREVLLLMADGLTSADIGGRLHLSEGTVKTYISRVYEKLGVSNRPAAIAEAMRRGILD